MNDVIEAIEAATDNETLEQLGRDFLEVEIDKRKKPESNQEYLLGVARAQYGDTTSQDDEVFNGGSEPARPAERMLKHRKTGRLFVWTEMLSKSSDLVEV